VLFLRTELVDVSDGSQLCGAYAEYPDVSGRDADKELANRILKQLKPAFMPVPPKVENAQASQRRLPVQLFKEPVLAS
jgi:hypothetical protein